MTKTPKELVTKNNIVASEVPITANVSDNKINPYIPKALRQLRAILPSALYAALQVEFDSDKQAWSINKRYSSGDFSIHAEDGIRKTWRTSATTIGSEPTTSNADWSEWTLGTFFINYVQPYLSHQVFLAYLVNGGVNITHQGPQRIANETAAPVDGNAYDALLSYWRSEMNITKAEMFNYLDSENNTLSSVVYEDVEPARKKRRFKIRPIG